MDDKFNIEDLEAMFLEDTDVKPDDFSYDLDLHQFSDSENEEFNGKFFVSYLGINPCILLKENTQELCKIIRHNLDINRLNFLIKNLKDFNSFMKKKLNEIQDINEQNEVLSIIQKFNSFIEEFEKMAADKDIDFTGLKIGNDYPNTITKLLSNLDYTYKFVEEITENNMAIKNEIKNLDIYNKLLEQMYILLKTSQEKMSENISDLVFKYKIKKYQYSDREVELMRKLEFPIAIIHNEDIFKDDFQYTEKKIDSSIDSYQSKMLYTLLVNMYLVGNNKKKIVEFYK